MAAENVAQDVFVTGFSMMRMMGVHPDRLYLGFFPFLQLGQYFALLLITMYCLFHEILCSETVEDIAYNTICISTVLIQVRY